ncbi:MAG TPA: chitosanase [Flavipsychrobacter sp.]|jgi:chitosanase|nr:chitosanase [Flavipsychrobacter sp.]
MAITSIQKNKILRVINVFETGVPDGKYDSISIYKDGTVNGVKVYQITYGRSQTTEFGNLKRMLELYISRNGMFAAPFRKFMSKIGKLPSLKDNVEFKSLLKTAAKQDVIMRQTQDEFFDIYYYQPAFNWFAGQQFTSALSMLVIYDSFIHSGSIPLFLRQKFAERTPLNGGDEKNWIKQYVDVRHNWLKTHSNTILQKTIYRTQCFKNQIKTNNWDLAQTIVANGTPIS